VEQEWPSKDQIKHNATKSLEVAIIDESCIPEGEGFV